MGSGLRAVQWPLAFVLNLLGNELFVGREPRYRPVRWLEEAGLGRETCQAWSHSSLGPEVVRLSSES